MNSIPLFESLNPIATVEHRRRVRPSNALPQPVIQNLQQVVNTTGLAIPGTEFSALSKLVNNRPLDELLEEFCKAAEQPIFKLTHLRTKEKDLKNWLSRLSAIGDYKTKRKELAFLIYQTLVKAEQQEDFRECLWNCLNLPRVNAKDSCFLAPGNPGNSTGFKPTSRRPLSLERHYDHDASDDHSCNYSPFAPRESHFLFCI